MNYDRRTALIVVDVQNDFAHPDGSLFVEEGDQVIGTINEHITAATEAGALVVYSQDWHPETTPHFAKDGGTWPVHGVQDTWGAELHADLLVLDDAARIRKGSNGEDGYSAFSMRDPLDPEAVTSTGLDEILTEADIQRVTVVGLATDYCVKETALDSARLGYETTVLDDAVRPVELEPGDGENAKAVMVASGVRIA
ncbi:MAG TPA: isochorismatase family protein [Acidimicrobiia bacterium]|nr:isochorismatase family protein [Acidimicrobiia bacterium]